MIQVDKDEMVNSIIKVTKDEIETVNNLIFVTKSGLVKRTSLEEFKNIRQSGKICITLREDDELIAVKKTTGNDFVLLGSSNGRMVKFNENDVRIMGRTASGVKGIELDDSSCIGAEIASEDDIVIIVTKKGYGKQTTVRDYRETKRGSKGVKALSITDKNGDIAAFKIARPDTDIVIITDAGMVMRMPLDQISILGRVTQGVRLINLKDDHTVATISLVDKEKEEEAVEEVVENSEVINNDNSDIVELAESEIAAAADEHENSDVAEEAAEKNLEVSEN